jgi:hypothetical protein
MKVIGFVVLCVPVVDCDRCEACLTRSCDRGLSQHFRFEPLEPVACPVAEAEHVTGDKGS